MKQDAKITKITIKPCSHDFEKIDMRIWKEGEDLRKYPRMGLLGCCEYDERFLVLLIRCIVHTMKDGELKKKYEAMDREYFKKEEAEK